MNFTIEKVKWSWPKKVQSPGVYRDDEFVRTKTKPETLKAIDFLAKQPRGLTYLITVFRDGEYFTYFRHSMPCLGGLVKYLDSHGEQYHMNPYFPRDIYVSFPEGDIIYITCHVPGIGAAVKAPYYQFALSEESPWVDAFGTGDSIIFKDSYFVLTNMDTDPTVFYSLMRQGRFAYVQNNVRKWHPKAEILGTMHTVSDPRRLCGQRPIKISGGTWAEGFGYTRPYNESIFKTSLPHKMPEFRKLGGYPQAPYTNKHFLSVMKDKFKVDASDITEAVSGKVQKADEMEKVFLEAWDYFKEQAEQLEDVDASKKSIYKAAKAKAS